MNFIILRGEKNKMRHVQILNIGYDYYLSNKIINIRKISDIEYEEYVEDMYDSPEWICERFIMEYDNKYKEDNSYE